MQTITFDGSTATITTSDIGTTVRVTEGDATVLLTTENQHYIPLDPFTIWGQINAAMKRAGMNAWTADRIAYMFELADRAIARASLAA